MLSSTNVALYSSNIFNNSNVSALDYSSNVGIGFTFNPTLSVNISPSDLIIPNLAPGTTSDSNIINVSVATNAAYGYTLSATVGDSLHNNTNLTHTNNTNIFSSIATDADLPSLTTDNTWGYNTSLDGGSTWSNYNGLSNSSNTTLLDKDSNISSSIDFRIGAKASSVQPSGTYTNTITFIAVTKPTPVTLSESYASEDKTMINGYYTMQDMTSTICEKTEAIGAQLQVLDKRDNKLYWISKLADNHCWMTQNLDLDLSHNKPLTSEDTDLNDSSLTGIYSINAGYSYDAVNNRISWTPANDTMASLPSSGFPYNNNANFVPYSYNPGDIYYYSSGDTGNDTKYTSLRECQEEKTNCGHYNAGNYYNWSAVVASNDTTEISSGDASNSICSKNWRLPSSAMSDFSNLATAYDINAYNSLNLRNAPIYLTRTGYYVGSLYNPGVWGTYWNSTSYESGGAGKLIFVNNSLLPVYPGNRYEGMPIRCLAR